MMLLARNPSTARSEIFLCLELSVVVEVPQSVVGLYSALTLRLSV